MTGRTTLVNAHLLASVWAAVPTTWHAWHYRNRAAALVPRLGRQVQVRRFWGGLALMLAPALLLSTYPRALSPLAQLGGGSRWVGDGLSGVFLDRLALAADGHTLIAGGRGIWVRIRSDQPWREVGPPDAFVLGMTAAPGAIYVGTSKGLLVSSQPDGPYTPLPVPAGQVHGIAVDPTAGVIWASSRAGVLRSSDGGATWSPQVAGMRAPPSSWAVAYFEGTVFASDEGGVYRWDGAQWRLSSNQAAVASLDVDTSTSTLFASSMGRGVRTLDAGGTWRAADSGLAVHGTGGAIHVTSVTAAPGDRIYASMMLGGVAASLDGGRSWGAINAGAAPRGGSWRAIQLGSDLYLATGSGIVRYDLPRAASAGRNWWILVIGLATAVTAVGLWVGALEPRPRRAHNGRRAS